MAAGTCPKCGSFVRTIDGNRTPITVGELRWKGITYHCPNPLCRAVLGCGIDPVALKAEIVEAVAAEVRKILQI